MDSSSSSPPSNYDVFLSFRGEDTRKTFVGHLYEAFDREGIKTFKDDERLEVGDEISEELERAIKGSKCAVVVLSENYTTSTWCLRELELIMSLYSPGKLQVLPIFYGVDISDVKHQTGSFSLERYADPKMAGNVPGWRYVLEKVCRLKGVVSKGWDEAKIVKSIVEDILTRLNYIPPTSLDVEFGVKAQIEQLKRLVAVEYDGSDPQVRMIGLWAHCFMENVDQQENLIHVQQQLLRGVLDIKLVDSRTVKLRGDLIRTRLQERKVFVVLDGVEKKEQLDALAKESTWFGPGSRIIITTRDKKLLDTCGVTTVHEVRCLEDEESLKMLKHFAFQHRSPPDEYEVLARRASRLAHGLPLALEAIGLHLCYSTSIKDWQDALGELEKSPLLGIRDILQSSYTHLDPESKTIFLKVACLFNGEPLHCVSALLSETETRIKSLADKSLIHISNDGFIEMHSLIQQVGREIVNEGSMYQLSQKNLLWDAREGYELLKTKRGTGIVEGMALHICELPQGASSIDGSAFHEMPNLRFIKFFKHFDDMKSKLDLTSKNYLLPSSLRLLHWDAYPLTTLPSKFPLDFLVELRLRYSNLESLWDGRQMLNELRTIDVTGSKKLRKLADFSMLPKLEELITKGCTRLKRIPETIGRLSLLDLSYCPQLNEVEKLIERFLKGEQTREVSKRFACLLGSSVPSYFNNQETSLPQISHASEYVGFDACIIIACPSHLRLHFSSSSYSFKQEDNDSYRINLKPDLFPQSETTSNGEVFSEHHMLIFHIPGNVNGHKFHLEPQLELSEEFQRSTPVQIMSYGVRAIRKTQEEDRDRRQSRTSIIRKWFARKKKNRK